MAVVFSVIMIVALIGKPATTTVTIIKPADGTIDPTLCKMLTTDCPKPEDAAEYLALLANEPWKSLLTRLDSDLYEVREQAEKDFITAVKPWVILRKKKFY